LVGILGWQFNVSQSKSTGVLDFFSKAEIPGTDLTNYFTHGTGIAACSDPGNTITASFAAVTANPCSASNGLGGCTQGAADAANFEKLGLVNSTRQVGFDWTQLASTNLSNYIVLDGNVLNMDPYINANPTALTSDTLDTVIRDLLNNSFAYGGRDGTKMFMRRPELKAAVPCLTQKYKAGHIDKKTTGCFVSTVILACSLGIVLAIVLARFFMALIFSWFVSRKLSRTPPPAPRSAANIINNQMEMANMPRMDSASTLTPAGGAMAKQVEVGNDLFTVLLITCYSENTEGIRATVESLSATEYPDDRKLLFLIADGIITGHGETVSTPDMCLSLINIDNPAMKNPEAMPYIAVAVGAKQFNCAKVYAGHYSKYKKNKESEKIVDHFLF
jgi:chitin synthase